MSYIDKESNLEMGQEAKSQTAINGLGAAALGALALGVLSTVADWVWANYLEDGALLPAIVHGIVVFLALAAVLASAAGTRKAWKRLLPTLPLVGFALAAVFYPVAGLVGYLPALLITWVGMWVALSFSQRWARDNQGSIGSAMLRGAVAAIGSGLAFWAISGIWTNPAEASDPLSLQRLASWTFAFLPGLVALLLRRRAPDPR